MSTPITLSEATFAAQVLESELPVVVDFGAPWCQPCRAIEPAMRELAAAYQGGREVGRLRGAAPKAKLQPAFEAALATSPATPA